MYLPDEGLPTSGTRVQGLLLSSRVALAVPTSRCAAHDQLGPGVWLGRRTAVWEARRMLDQRARQTLDLEASWWRHAGTKDAAIREVFAEEPEVYYRRLGRLIDDADALVHAPVLIRRLRRQRAQRLGSRSGRRLAG
jgi:hypothetical protein